MSKPNQETRVVSLDSREIHQTVSQEHHLTEESQDIKHASFIAALHQ